MNSKISKKLSQIDNIDFFVHMVTGLEKQLRMDYNIDRWMMTAEAQKMTHEEYEALCEDVESSLLQLRKIKASNTIKAKFLECYWSPRHPFGIKRFNREYDKIYKI